MVDCGCAKVSENAFEMRGRVEFVFLAGCASPDGAPFPERIKFTSPGHFLYVTQGTWDYPANSASGEKERLSWLADYLSRSHACPAGHQIAQRILGYIPMSPKRSVEDQEQRSITYVGNCLS